MSFEWYAPDADMLMVSISQNSITFYNQTVQAMKCPEYIQLGYDQEENVIAVKAHHRRVDNCIEFKNKKHTSYIRISVRNFVRLIEAKLGQRLSSNGSPVKYLALWEDNEEMLYIFLK